MLRISQYIIAFLLSAGLIGCSAPQNKTQGGLRVVTTTAIVGDVVANIGDPVLKPYVLLPAGSSPHNFEPTPQDLKKTGAADLIFINGAGLEIFLDRLLTNSGTKSKVISLSQHLNLRARQQDTAEINPNAEETRHHGTVDPHVWTDPNNILSWIDVAVAELSKRDTVHSERYQKNAAAYRKRIEELDQWISDQVSRVPSGRRRIISDHLMFGHFCNRYGFEQAGAIIPGFSTLSEPSARDLARLEDTIRKMHVPAVFVGNTFSPRLASRLSEDTGTKLVTLYTGSLGPQGSPADNYIGYMKYNVTAIVNALSAKKASQTKSIR